MADLDPTLDIVFKLLLVREPVLLRDMLSGILGRSVAQVALLDPEVRGASAQDRRVRFDVRARLDDGSRTDLEMQRRMGPALRARLLYYGARDYSSQLRIGDDFSLLTPTTGIIWLMEPLVTGPKRLHSTFELREIHDSSRWTDHLALHVLQPSFLPPGDPGRYTSSVERWACFFRTDDDGRRRLAAHDPIMAIAVETLQRLSVDPKALRLALEREDEVKLDRMDREMAIAASHEAGKIQGDVDGRADILITLLNARFGPPPRILRDWVYVSSARQIDAWAKRTLTAKTLDDVFGD